MSVCVIRDDSHFTAELSKAGNHLVVVDFTASWCGPCQKVAPVFETFPKKYPNALFLKVDVDKCQETAVAQGVKAMPTFVFYRNRQEVDRLQGADLNGLAAKIVQNIRPDDQVVSAFSGKGHTLGGSAPTAFTPASSSGENETNEKLALAKMDLDESKPVTTVSMRLADGSRLSGRFNWTHSVADLRLFIITARPQYGGKNFSLFTTFPMKLLADSETVQSAGLINAAITIRFN